MVDFNLIQFDIFILLKRISGIKKNKNLLGMRN